MGFEQRCHDARLASNRIEPEMERTKNKTEYRFLHLRVHDQGLDTPAQDVLFTDISGEIFREIRDSAHECSRHPIFRRADHFVAILDGAKLCDPLLRHQAVVDINMLLRRCFESNMLGASSLLDVIFTKWDMIKALIDNDPRVGDQIGIIESDYFQTPFAHRVASLQVAHIAARPQPSLRSGLERAHGVAPLFRSWVEIAPLSRTLLPHRQHLPLPMREIDRFRSGPDDQTVVGGKR
jgi:hypothetical protein